MNAVISLKGAGENGSDVVHPECGVAVGGRLVLLDSGRASAGGEVARFDGDRCQQCNSWISRGVVDAELMARALMSYEIIVPGIC
jgi:hypothetical protein